MLPEARCGLENKFVEHVVLAVRRSTGCRRSHFGCGWSSQCDWILRRLAMTISHRFIETNGIRMHLAEAGSGPTVLLCHGFPECWYSWRHQLEGLAAAGYRAIAPDMRGYGQTDKPDAIDQYTLLHLTGDMVGLLDAIGTDQAVVVGHDWGAPVAWRCALFRPDRFRAVVGLSGSLQPNHCRRGSRTVTSNFTLKSSSAPALEEV